MPKVTIEDFRKVLEQRNVDDACIILSNGVMGKRKVTTVDSTRDTQQANREVRQALYEALSNDANASHDYLQEMRGSILGEEVVNTPLSARKISEILEKRDEMQNSVKSFQKMVGKSYHTKDEVGFKGIVSQAAHAATSVFSGREIKSGAGLKALLRFSNLNLDKRNTETLLLLERTAGEKLKAAYDLKGRDIQSNSKTISAAIDALFDLAEGLRFAVNKGMLKLTPGLALLMDYCSARASEISAVYHEAVDAAQADGKAVSDSTVRDLVSAKAETMHGNEAYVAELKEGKCVAEFENQLKALKSKNGSDTMVDLKEIEVLREKFVQLRCALQEKPQSSAENSLSATLIARIERDIENLDDLMRQIDVPKLVQSLFTSFQNFAITRDEHNFEVNHKRYLKKDDLSEIGKDLTNVFSQSFDEGKYQEVVKRLSVCVKESRIKQNTYLVLKDRLDALAKIARDKDLAHGPVSHQLLEGLLKGEYGFGSVVGAYAHGFQARDVDPSLDDRFLVSCEPGKSGANNTAEPLVYEMPDGTVKTRVFKSEHQARFGLTRMRIDQGASYDTVNRIGEINVSTRTCAERMGCPGIVPRVTIGTHAGKIGFFMDKAEGMEAGEAGFSQNTASPVSAATLRKLSSDDRIQRVGTLARELCKLEWHDWLTGQLDRHNANYFVGSDQRGNPIVTGIDNDCAFMGHRIGVRRFVLDSSQMRNLMEEIGASDFKALKQRLGDDSIVKEDGRYVLDLDKVIDEKRDGKWLRDKIAENVLGAMGIARPIRIPASVARWLAEVRNDHEKPGKSYEDIAREMMRGHFTDAQIKATASRLAEMAEYAAQHPDMVMEEEDWLDEEKLKSIIEEDSNATSRTMTGYLFRDFNDSIEVIRADLQRAMPPEQIVRKKTKALFTEGIETGTKPGALRMAEKYVLNMPDNEAFTEKGVRFVNGKPQTYTKLSETGRELAKAAYKACQQELNGLDNIQFKATYLREIEKNLASKLEELADEILLDKYSKKNAYGDSNNDMYDVNRGTFDDVSRTAARMLAVLPEIGTVCCRNGKLTAFGLCVVDRATALCREEFVKATSSTSRYAYVRDIKVHLREKLEVALKEYATYFNDIQAKPLPDPESHLGDLFKMTGFEYFADYARNFIIDPASPAAKSDKKQFQECANLAADYFNSTDITDQLSRLPENVAALFQRTCVAKLMSLLLVVKESNSADLLAEMKMRVAVLAEGCKKAVALTERLEKDSGIKLSDTDRIRIEDAFVLNSTLPHLLESQPLGIEGKKRVESELAKDADKVAEERLSAVRKLNECNGFTSVELEDLKCRVLYGGIKIKYIETALAMAEEMKKSMEKFPVGAPLAQKFDFLIPITMEALKTCTARAPVELREDLIGGSTGIIEAALQILSKAVPAIAQMLKECDSETVAAYKQDMKEKLDECLNALTDNLNVDLEDVRKNKLPFYTAGNHIAGVFEDMCGWRPPREGTLLKDDVDAIGFAQQKEAKPAGGDAELRAAIEAKLVGQTGSAAAQKLVKKMMAEFREGLDKLKDPQDRAFYLASRDEWIAEFLEGPAKTVRRLADGWEVIESDELVRADRNDEMRGWLARKLDGVARRNPKVSHELKVWIAKLTPNGKSSPDLDSEVCRQLLVLIDAGDSFVSPEVKKAFAKLSDHFAKLPLPGSLSPREADNRLKSIEKMVRSGRGVPPGRPAEVRAELRDILMSLEFPGKQSKEARNALVRNLEAGYDPELQDVPLTDIELLQIIDALKTGKTFVKAPLPGNLDHAGEIQALKAFATDFEARWKSCLALNPNTFAKQRKMALLDLDNALWKISQKIADHLAKASEDINVSLLIAWARHEMEKVENAHGDTLKDIQRLADERSQASAKETGKGKGKGKGIPLPQGKLADKKMTERVIKAAPKVKKGEIKPIETQVILEERHTKNILESVEDVVERRLREESKTSNSPVDADLVDWCKNYIRAIYEDQISKRKNPKVDDDTVGGLISEAKKDFESFWKAEETEEVRKRAKHEDVILFMKRAAEFSSSKKTRGSAPLVALREILVQSPDNLRTKEAVESEFKRRITVLVEKNEVPSPDIDVFSRLQGKYLKKTYDLFVKAHGELVQRLRASLDPDTDAKDEGFKDALKRILTLFSKRHARIEFSDEEATACVVRAVYMSLVKRRAEKNKLSLGPINSYALKELSDRECAELAKGDEFKTRIDATINQLMKVEETNSIKKKAEGWMEMQLPGLLRDLYKEQEIPEEYSTQDLPVVKKCIEHWNRNKKNDLASPDDLTTYFKDTIAGRVRENVDRLKNKECSVAMRTLLLRSNLSVLMESTVEEYFNLKEDMQAFREALKKIEIPSKESSPSDEFLAEAEKAVSIFEECWNAHYARENSKKAVPTGDELHVLMGTLVAGLADGDEAIGKLFNYIKTTFVKTNEYPKFVYELGEGSTLKYPRGKLLWNAICGL